MVKRDTYIESESFAFFVKIMGDMKDRFIRDTDNEVLGLFGKCKQIEFILQNENSKMFNRLQKINLTADFYALRWIMVLMC